MLETPPQQGIYLRLFPLATGRLPVVGSGQNDKNLHGFVRFGFAKATGSQDFG